MTDQPLEFEALDGMNAEEAANTIANTLDVFGASPHQIELFEEEIHDALMGAAKEIHLEIGSTIVTAEIDDNDVLFVNVDGDVFLEVDTSGIDL